MPVEIVWSALARRRLQEIRDYVAKDKPMAAARLAMRIVAVTQVLCRHPFIGRSSSEPGVRELVISRTPYIIVYKVRASTVIITTIWHGAQRRPE